MASFSNPEPNLLVLEGEIDLSQSPALREQFRTLLEEKPPALYVDLSLVRYIDSSGLAALIEAMQKVNQYGGHLALFGIRENVRTIFQISRLDLVFRIFPDRESARAALEIREP